MTVRDDIIAIPDDVLRAGCSQVGLVFMDFRNAPRRWWTGWGNIEALGQTWQGVGDLIQISGLTSSYQLTADPVTFTLSATQELVALTREGKANVRGREVTIWSYLLDLQGQPIGAPWVAWTGEMGEPEFSISGNTDRLITLQCEGLFAQRNRPPHGLLTDLDQRARHPGDRGLERVALHKNHEVRWI